MLVRDVMTANPGTVRPESDPLGALAIMKARRCHHMPVIDENNCVVGLVTWSDIQLFLSTKGSPGVIKRQHHIEQVMNTPVITTRPDCPIEEAASTMIQHRISSLPVVEKDGALVGIITETDIFEQLVTSLGGNTNSLRLTVQVTNAPGQFAQLTRHIAEANGNIISVITAPTSDPSLYNLTLRVTGVSADTLLKAVEQCQARVLQIWQASIKT